MRKIIIGNWKMNGDKRLIDEFAPLLSTSSYDCVMCPPFTLIDVARSNFPASVFVGAQDCSMFDNGAHTGEISCKQIFDVGGTHVIIGHNERRANNGDSDEVVAQKVKCAIRNKLIPIVCIGESKEEYDCGKTIEIVKKQISSLLQGEGIDVAKFFIAYEPIWAIGTGRTPTVSEVDEIHGHIYKFCGIYPVYGGSITYENHKDFLNLNSVTGLLIGGTSLNSKDFSKILSCLD
ncbi:MAG: triose-phosphate isomerase [Holosporales bacterium]|jgi:triosephosphate isomerase|nr:triose-phosphate isomerase [Holosporales bacterium]